MSWWPFSKAKKAETDEVAANFKKLIAESKERSDDLEAVAERLRKNRKEIHQRADQLLGEENVVVTRQALKSTPG
jgi:hypothetical protein